MNPALAGGLVQTNQTKPFELWSVSPTVSTGQLARTGCGDPGLNWNWKPLASTNFPAKNFTNGTWSLPPSPQCLKPGLYKTSPYTLLVLVPGPQYDDAGIAKSGMAEPEKMPVLRRGLKFTPYSFAEK